LFPRNNGKRLNCTICRASRWPRSPRNLAAPVQRWLGYCNGVCTGSAKCWPRRRNPDMAARGSRSAQREQQLNEVLAEYLEAAEGRQRFLTEAEAVGRFDHPGIVTIYEFGEADRLLYFSMQYLSGGNLGQWAEKQGWTSGVRQPNRVFQSRQRLAASLLAR